MTAKNKIKIELADLDNGKNRVVNLKDRNDNLKIYIKGLWIANIYNCDNILRIQYWPKTDQSRFVRVEG